MQDRAVVMVVEDDVEMNRLECELLEVSGLKAIGAYTGVEALRLINQCHADAVLLDVMLPEMDGFETCRRLRSMTGGDGAGRLPIVIVTALDTEDCRQLGYEADADAYFTKPFDPEGVVETILRLINERNGPDADGRGHTGDGRL